MNCKKCGNPVPLYDRCQVCARTHIDTAQMGEVTTTETADCQCGHSWYDHVGHRASWDKKTNCRIVRCTCEAWNRN